MSDSKEVKLGQLVDLYEGLSTAGKGKERRLEQARELCQNAAAVAAMFTEDVEAFGTYDNRQVAFHSQAEDRDTKSFAPRSKTRVVAQSLMTMIDGRTVRVDENPELDFVYVDRELVTARTPGGKFTSFDGTPRSSSSPPILDLLLANADDKTPIVAELKVDEDKDPFYALIQVLAHAAMLATKSQLARLFNEYGTEQHQFAIGQCDQVDVYSIQVGEVDDPTWKELDVCAKDLGSELMAIPSFSSKVRRLEQIELSVSAGLRS